MTPRPVLPNSIPPVVGTVQQAEPKFRGANRSTKIAGKLKVLPDQPTTQAPEPTKQRNVERPPSEVEEGPSTTVETDDGDDEEEEEMDEDEEEFTEVRLRQISQMPQGTARRDALRLTKKKAKSLPRVTAYATAGYVFPGRLCVIGYRTDVPHVALIG